MITLTIKEFFFNPRAPAIVGGADASPGQFPYQLSLKFGNENKCGAVLINYHLAITAAHCCDHILKYKNEIWSVVAGEHTISKREKSEQVSTIIFYLLQLILTYSADLHIAKI